MLKTSKNTTWHCPANCPQLMPVCFALAFHSGNVNLVNIFAVWWCMNYTLLLQQGHYSFWGERRTALWWNLPWPGEIWSIFCVCNRAKFVSVTEDFMLLGVGVIAVAAFIHHISTWEKVQNSFWIYIMIQSVSCEGYLNMLLASNLTILKDFSVFVSCALQVVEELTGITGISGQSIMDFAYVTLTHITKTKSMWHLKSEI